MIVVADAGPLHYLVLIGAVHVLQPLYNRVLVPQTVATELMETGAPNAVRTWIAQPPDWCEIRPDPPSEPALQFLDPGERAAITLALSLVADRLLIDEWKGAPRPSGGISSSPTPWAFSPRPINGICSILRWRSRGFIRRTFIFRRHSSIVSVGSYHSLEITPIWLHL